MFDERKILLSFITFAAGFLSLLSYIYKENMISFGILGSSFWILLSLLILFI